MSKITKSARGEDCTLRIPGVCNFDPETTVFAHTGSGTAKRNHDKGCYACSDCHDAIDFRTRAFLSDSETEQKQFKRVRAVYVDCAEHETQKKLREKGLIGA
jgi:hypothetical protein